MGSRSSTPGISTRHHIAAKFPSATIGTMEVRPLMEPAEPAADPLDQKIQAAILRNVSGFNPFVPSQKMVSVPQPDRTAEQ